MKTQSYLLLMAVFPAKVQPCLDQDATRVLGKHLIKTDTINSLTTRSAGKQEPRKKK